MTYTDAQARQQLLDVLAQAADEIGFALASLGEAYEQLDEHAADRLEEQLFRPVQAAYGLAKRTHAEFAARCGLPSPAFQSRTAGAPSSGPKGFLDSALDAVGRADSALGTLQDSMLPVDVGDPALRAGLAEVRELIGPLPGRAREFVRTFGR